MGAAAVEMLTQPTATASTAASSAIVARAEPTRRRRRIEASTAGSGSSATAAGFPPAGNQLLRVEQILYRGDLHRAAPHTERGGTHYQRLLLDRTNSARSFDCWTRDGSCTYIMCPAG